MVCKPRSFKTLIGTFGVALMASLTLGAVGVASASAATQHWYVGGTKLAEGTPTSITPKGTTSFNLAWKFQGINFEFKCTSQEGNGTIENPAGGGAGTDYGSSLVLSGCKGVRPVGAPCEIIGGSINMGTNGVADEFEAKPAVKFSQLGSAFTEIWLSGCSYKAYNPYVLEGSFTGIANSTTSSLEFTKASSAIHFGAFQYPVTLVGSSHLETTGGQTVTVAP